MFDATDAAARRSWVTSPYRSVEGNCFVARSEEHTSELQSLAYLVCRLIISEEHTSELQSLAYLVCRLLLEKKNTITYAHQPHNYEPELQSPNPSAHAARHPPIRRPYEYSH